MRSIGTCTTLQESVMDLHTEFSMERSFCISGLSLLVIASSVLFTPVVHSVIVLVILHTLGGFMYGYSNSGKSIDRGRRNETLSSSGYNQID